MVLRQNNTQGSAQPQTINILFPMYFISTGDLQSFSNLGLAACIPLECLCPNFVSLFPSRS